MNGNVVKLKDYRPGAVDETGRREMPKARRWPAIGKGIRLVFRLLGKVAMFALFFVMATLRGPLKVLLAMVALVGLGGAALLSIFVAEIRPDQWVGIAGGAVIGGIAFLAWYWFDILLERLDPVVQRYYYGR